MNSTSVSQIQHKSQSYDTVNYQQQRPQ